ncbi:AGAP004948-PA-like protein [Anopheles sinensis]|uniref:AGAP004948-PA-like protein n=1 Tax=Anopheles sinensis TaxID=74873 RepID=A0A084WE40_ANOSI|nr:AGAP004948-PA-like protein [Anopheles sinensis]
MYAVVLITLSAHLHPTLAGCRVNLNGDLTQPNAPLFLKSSSSSREYELLQPSGAFFEWSTGERVVVGCSTGKNVLTNIGTGTANLTCIDAQKFSLDGRNSKRLDLSEISCNSPMSGAIMTRNVTCADGTGRIYELGFDVNGLPFVRYFAACYNLEKLSAIYSEHLLTGKLLSHAQIGNTRPSFKVGGIPSKVSLASVYTRKHQQERFATLLGSETLASQYINSSSYLAKGHLTPDGDAIVDSWTAATYFFINAAPEWQAINVGNWLRVENAVRKVATQLNDTVLVYTGVHDILRLPGPSGRPVPITLADGGLVEVPKWLWKVVVHRPTGSGIALITLNNPFVAGGETLCEDICSRYGWQQKEFQDVRKGFTYCCAVRDAQKAIKMMPKSIAAAHVLRHS